MQIRARVVQACLVTLLVSACSTGALNDKPGTTYGEILISGVAVDTRERLISDRRDQYAWLQQQLNQVDEADFGVNGERTRKSATMFSLNASANVDPTGTALYAAETANQLAGLKNAAKLKELDNDIEIAKRKLILKNAETETDPSKISVPTAAGSPSAPTSTVPAPIAATAPKETSESVKAVFESMAGALAPSSNGKMVPSPVDLFRDKLAYREEIRNEMISYSLDDRHDMRGNALYRVSLDATVLPGNDSGDWAVISVCVQRPGSARCKTRPSGSPGPNGGPISAAVAYRDEVPAEEAPRKRQHAQDKKISTSADSIGTVFEDVDGAALKRALTADFYQRKERLFVDLARQFSDPKKTLDLNNLERKNKALILNGSRRVLSARKKQLAGGGVTPTVDKAGFEKVIRTLQLMADGAKPIVAADLKVVEGAVSSVCTYLDSKNFEVNSFPLYVEGEMVANACEPGEKDAALLLLQYFGLVGLAVDMQELLYKQSDWSELPENYFAAASTQLSRGCGRHRNRDCYALGSVNSPIAFVDNSLVINIDLVKLVTQGLKRETLEIYAYGATPKESVQRIADVVTRREGVQLALGLQALAGNVGVSTLTNFMKTNEGVFNALKRQPLVVGFGHSNANSATTSVGEVGPSDFGWIIGPRYGSSSDGKQANFRHSVIQNGLSAVISIPGWWDKAELVIDRYWVDGTGRFTTVPASDSPRTLSQMKHSISVPGTTEDVLSVLNGDSLLRVQPERFDEPAWRVKVGSSAEIMIRGKNLWRVPQVRLGSQYATKVKIMPDMDGVVAIFSPVVESYGAPTTIAGRAAPKDSVPVTIATPGGMELVGFAEFVKEPTPEKKLAVDGGPLLFGDLENKLALNMSLPGYSDIRARYRKAGSPTKFLDAKSAEIARPKSNLLTLKPTSLATLKAGDQVELQLLLTYAKGDEPQTLSVGGALVYYPKRDDWKVRVAAISSSPASPKEKDPVIYTVKLNFPPGYETALGIANNTAGFIASNRDSIGKLECKIAENSCDLLISLPAGIGAEGLSLMPVELKDSHLNPFEKTLKAPIAAPAKPSK